MALESPRRRIKELVKDDDGVDDADIDVEGGERTNDDNMLYAGVAGSWGLSVN